LGGTAAEFFGLNQYL